MDKAQDHDQMKEIEIEKEDPTPVLPRDDADSQELHEEPPASSTSTAPFTVKQAVESLLFATDTPLSTRKLMSLIHPFTSCSFDDVYEAIESLKNEYDIRNSAFELKDLAGGFILQTKEVFFPVLDHYFQKQTPQRLSPAAYEVLATIAYRQPITRAEIDVIRGVDSSGALSSLNERELIKVVGKKEVPGYPPMYGTTPEFLKLCGLGSIKDLPELKELKKPKRRKPKKTQEKKTPEKPRKAQEINLTLPF